MDHLIKQLIHISNKPKYDTDEYREWIEQGDIVNFLQAIPQATDVILYASISYSFIYGVLVPRRLVTPPNVEDLRHWSCNPFSSWGISLSFGKGRKIWLSPPLNHTGTKTLDQGEQIVFARQFDGRQEQQSYIELSQRLTHAFGLHWVPEREAYCRFDDRGDVEEVVRVTNVTNQSTWGAGRIVTIMRNTLDEYLTITDQVLVLLFDSTRFEPKRFGGWPNQAPKDHDREPEIYYYIGRNTKDASYVRGFQIIRPAVSKGEVLSRYGVGKPKQRQYTTYIAHDWKHGKVHECSCDPKLLGNYFVTSDFPFEISPAFFRPEVLQKYKADTDKYQLTDRYITCRHAWHLETYDINEAGQLHTYPIYFSHLPYEEQIYWKSFNEPPKGPISRRAFQTDFEGRWDHQYDPLQSLRVVLLELDEIQASWWALRDTKLLENVHYPVTKAADEWAKELHALDKLLVEGFVTGDLRARAEGAGRTIDMRWMSLKLLEEVLVGIGFGNDQAREIVEPLQELHLLRSKISGHVSGKTAEGIKADILKKHKTYPNHFRDLCARCDRAIRTTKKAFTETV